MSTSNTAANVSVGKPKIAGAVYCAPKGSTLPTDATTALDAAFKALGYVSEDGVTNTNSPETETIKAWGGDVVLTTLTGKADQFKLTLIESLNTDVLKAVYGSSNVSGSTAAGLSVRANSTMPAASAWVIEMILTGNIAKRIVIPEAQIAEIGDIVYKDSEAIGYELTLNALPCADLNGGDTHIEYIKAPST